MTRYALLTVFVVAAITTLVGCDSGIANLDVENTNDPTRDALQTGDDYEDLLAGATTQALQVTVSEWGPHMDLLADQTTSTNAFRSFWDFAEEPRLQLNTRPTYATPAIFTDPWNNLNSAQGGANVILEITETNDEDIIREDGTDITAKMRASAYFARGVTRGYLGMIYNQAYIVPEEQDVIENPLVEPSPYPDVIAAAVDDLEQAISIAEENDFTWDFVLGNSYNSAEFQAIAHSLAARFLMAEARTQQELDAYTSGRLDQIISHAEQGVGADGPLPSFSPASTSGEFYNANADWSSLVVGGPAGYLPMDVKISHLLDPSYPVEYPEESGAILEPHETEDPRAAYFSYTEAFGFLSAARNRSLFSNYLRLRNDGGNNWMNLDGVAVTIATGSEMQYLKAEANLLKGDRAAAATALENSPFGSVPTELTNDLPSVQGEGFEFLGEFPANGIAAGKTISSDATDEEFVRALHTEYAVELDLMGGIGSQWYFMRRHDLLQPGTALQYPIPGEELEILQEPFYTFGGANRTGESGTATGDNNWRTYDARHGTDATAIRKTHQSSQEAELQNYLEQLQIGPVSTPYRAQEH